jgi:crossover junction endodeoxyribonuclease RuvC
MLKSLLKFDESPQFLDATDGLAVAVCHSFQQTVSDNGATTNSYSGWDAFAKANASRIKTKS